MRGNANAGDHKALLEMHKMISGISQIQRATATIQFGLYLSGGCRGKKPRPWRISFLPNWDPISRAPTVIDARSRWPPPTRPVYSSCPGAILLTVTRPGWNIACYSSDRVPTSLLRRGLLKTDYWFMYALLLSPALSSRGKTKCACVCMKYIFVYVTWLMKE